MPNYEIRYLNKDSAIAAKFRVALGSDREAKAFAHAVHVQMDSARQIAVWENQRLIFTRPISAPLAEEERPVFEPTMALAPAAAG